MTAEEKQQLLQQMFQHARWNQFWRLNVFTGDLQDGGLGLLALR